MGARPLRRAIQRLIEDPLADFILGRELTPSSTIIVDKRQNPVGDESLVEIRLIEGPPVPATVGGPEDASEDGELPSDDQPVDDD
jgi:ATP-dependent Clp protease ATP-binding subunit ClpC